MNIATLNAYERLWKLNDHADLQAYGPDLLITDVETVIAALASAEREIAELRSQLAAVEASAAFQIGSAVINAKGGTA